MHIDIYEGKNNKFVSVPTGTDVEKCSLPNDPDIQKLTMFKCNKEIGLAQPPVGMNDSDIITQINAKGYAIHSAGTQIDESFVKKD